MFEDLCDRAGELKICVKCGKESDTARATESDFARGKVTMLFLPEGHPSSDGRHRNGQPEAEEPIFYPEP